MKLYFSVLLSVVTSVAADQRFFLYDRTVNITPFVAGQSCLSLDVDTFAHASSRLADLRLYRDNVETPYVINVAAPTQVAASSIGLLNLGLHGKQVTFDATMPEGRYSDLTLGTTAQNFIATVTVFGSHAATGDLGTKLGSYTIFDLTSQRLGHSTVIHLPESDFRHLHFQIAGPLTPDQITNATIDKLPASQPKYEPVASSSDALTKGHTSIFVFSIPAHVPVDRLVFTPGPIPEMFSRDVQVEVQPTPRTPRSDDSEPPSPIIATGNLLRVHRIEDGRRIDEDRLTIVAPTVDFATPSRWTISIENGDDVPLNTSVRLEMLKRDLCFEVMSNARYTLFYGDPLLSTPVYDYTTLFSRQLKAVQANEGPEQRNPLYQDRPDVRPFTEKHPALLWTALVAVIALLGSIAVSSFRTDRSGQPPPGTA